MSDEAEGGDAVLMATQLSDLARVIDHVDRCCRSVDVPGEAASEVRLATEEVFVNILQHGYGGRPGTVTLHVDASPGRVTVTLTDEAPAFDSSTVAAPEMSADWERRRLGGMGWHLVRQVMDEVRHAHSASGGNVYTLVKEIPRAQPGSRDR